MENHFNDINPFAKEYELISDSRLIDILKHEDDYQPLAIEAGQAELRFRKLSPEKVAEAGAIAENKRSLDAEKEKKLQAKVFLFFRGHKLIHNVVIFISVFLLLIQTLFSAPGSNIFDVKIAEVSIGCVFLLLRYFTKK